MSDSKFGNAEWAYDQLIAGFPVRQIGWRTGVHLQTLRKTTIESISSCVISSLPVTGSKTTLVIGMRDSDCGCASFLTMFDMREFEALFVGTIWELFKKGES